MNPFIALAFSATTGPSCNLYINDQHQKWRMSVATGESLHRQVREQDHQQAHSHDDGRGGLPGRVGPGVQRQASGRLDEWERVSAVALPRGR
jgi:hypothetical protein